MRTEIGQTRANVRELVRARRPHHKVSTWVLWCSRLGCTRGSVEPASIRGFLVLALLWSAPTVSVASASLEVTVPQASVRVGDRVAVRVAARGGEDRMWGGLRVAVDEGDSWAVVDGPSEVAGARPPAWELVLAPMEIGDLPLPAFVAGVRDDDGATGEVVAAELPTVTVVSVLPDDEEARPAPLRDPIGVTGFPWEWVLPLAVPVLGAAAAFAWWGRRRRRRDGVAGVAVPAPFDELAALLDRLEGRIGREPADGVCDRLAGGLRHYLERTSGEPAQEMTSFELRLLARRERWPDAVQRGIQDVLGVADRVRFGRRSTDEGELGRAIDTVRDAARRLEEHLSVDDADPAALEAAG